MKKTINTQTYHSLCGDLLLGSFEGKLCLCDWMAEEHRLLADRRLERSLNAEMKDIPSEITAKAPKNLMNILPEDARHSICHFCSSAPSFRRKYGTPCWKSLTGRPGAMAGWPR